MIGNMGRAKGGGKPAYFRNVNMLLGQYYESIMGDPNYGILDHFTVDLEEALPALERAKHHAVLWIEEHEKWR